MAERKLKQSKGNVKTRKSGRSLVPDSLQVPKDSDSDDDDDGDDGVVVQEIGSDIGDRGDFDEVYDRIEDEGEAVVEEGEKEEHYHTFTYNKIWSNLQEVARGEQALWIFHDGAGNFKVSI